MKLIKTARVQQSKTNTTLNIPREHAVALGIEKGTVLLIETNTENGEIKIKRV